MVVGLRSAQRLGIGTAGLVIASAGGLQSEGIHVLGT